MGLTWLARYEGALPASIGGQPVLWARIAAFHRGLVESEARTEDSRLRIRWTDLQDVDSMARDYNSLIDRRQIRDRSRVDGQTVAVVAQYRVVVMILIMITCCALDVSPSATRKRRLPAPVRMRGRCEFQGQRGRGKSDPHTTPTAAPSSAWWLLPQPVNDNKRVETTAGCCIMNLVSSSPVTSM